MRAVGWEFGLLDCRSSISSWVIVRELVLLGQNIPVLHHTSNNQVINRDTIVCFRARVIECLLQLVQVVGLKQVSYT
jgi:hypothetical protein